MKYHSLAILIPRLWYAGTIHEAFPQLMQNQKTKQSRVYFIF